MDRCAEVALTFLLAFTFAGSSKERLLVGLLDLFLFALLLLSLLFSTSGTSAQPSFSCDGGRFTLASTALSLPLALGLLLVGLLNCRLLLLLLADCILSSLIHVGAYSRRGKACSHLTRIRIGGKRKRVNYAAIASNRYNNGKPIEMVRKVLFIRLQWAMQCWYRIIAG